MSEKDHHKGMGETAKGSSVDQSESGREAGSAVFYRCTCPKCGENALELSGHGVFLRSEFLGVTREGEFGCGDLMLDGEYHWEIECGTCGYRPFSTDVLPAEPLLDWAANHGQAMKQLRFTCTVCGSHSLKKVYRMSRFVRAVYEDAESEERAIYADVALSYEQVIEHGKSVRYCCSEGHGLANDDGTPVETAKQLVEWLKAQQRPNKDNPIGLPGMGLFGPCPPKH
jgi:Zn finger protein HypA/HybF involved in hydrogenase expression